MSREEIIQLASQAGFLHLRHVKTGFDVLQPVSSCDLLPDLERFAWLVIAATQPKEPQP